MKRKLIALLLIFCSHSLASATLLTLGDYVSFRLVTSDEDHKWNGYQNFQLAESIAKIAGFRINSKLYESLAFQIGAYLALNSGPNLDIEKPMVLFNQNLEIIDTQANGRMSTNVVFSRLILDALYAWRNGKFAEYVEIHQWMRSRSQPNWFERVVLRKKSLPFPKTVEEMAAGDPLIFALDQLLHSQDPDRFPRPQLSACTRALLIDLIW